jgi:hypothetical protein
LIWHNNDGNKRGLRVVPPELVHAVGHADKVTERDRNNYTVVLSCCPGGYAHSMTQSRHVRPFPVLFQPGKVINRGGVPADPFEDSVPNLNPVRPIGCSCPNANRSRRTLPLRLVSPDSQEVPGMRGLQFLWAGSEDWFAWQLEPVKLVRSSSIASRANSSLRCASPSFSIGRQEKLERWDTLRQAIHLVGSRRRNDGGLHRGVTRSARYTAYEQNHDQAD